MQFSPKNTWRPILVRSNGQRQRLDPAWRLPHRSWHGSRLDLDKSTGQWLSEPQPTYQQTADKGIWYHSCKKPQLLTFCDASLGNIPGRISADAHKDAGKSTGGHVVYLAGGAVAWSSRTQTIVATSSTESELIQTESAAKNTIVLRRITGDMGHATTAPTKILCDNQPCLDLLKDSHSATNRRSSHIERRWFKARELQEAGLIDMLKVPTHDNIADIFTKPLGRILHERFTQMLVRDEHPTPTMPVFTTPKKRKLSEV